MRAGLALAILFLIPAAHAATEPPAPAYQTLDEEAEGEFDLRAEVTVPQAPAAPLLRIGFCWSNAGNTLVLELGPREARILEVRATKSRTLISVPAPALTPGLHRLVLKHRDLYTSALLDGVAFLSLPISQTPGTGVATAARDLELGEVIVQPVGEMEFNDDFARPPGEPDPWESVRGSWAVRLPESRNNAVDPSRSSNPFSFVGSGADALALTGDAYWDTYRFHSAVRLSGPGSAGLVAYAQDARNYCLARVTVPPPSGAPSSLELIRVQDGVPTVLAQSQVTVETAKWFELGLRAGPAGLVATVDGAPVCTSSEARFAEGRVGLAVDGTAPVHFDDVHLEPDPDVTITLNRTCSVPLSALDGTWRINAGSLVAEPANRGRPTKVTFGAAAWQDYALAATINPGAAAAVGLIVAWQGPANHALFRWGPDAQGVVSQQLWSVRDGASTLLASRPAPLPKAPCRFQFTACRGYLAVSVDGVRAVEAADLALACTGPAGLLAEGAAKPRAAFSQLSVTPCPPLPEPVSIVDQFAREDTMADWARPVASWKALGDRIYAYALPCWGDFVLRIRLGILIGHDGAISLLTAPDRQGLRTAEPRLRLVSHKGGAGLEAVVTGGPGQGQEAPSTDEEPLLEIERQGACLIARLDGEPVGWAACPDPATNPAVAIKLEGLGVNLNEATLASHNILDTSFSQAPTAWQPQAGTWEISDRWNCQPQWSWFCGRGAQTPLIWSKQSYTGDMVMEFWAGMMMDLTGGPGYSHASDINSVICGDGANLCSGYAFVFAGDGNTRGQILRKGETVAQTTSMRFMNPTSGGDLNQFHRHWFHCRIERTGSHITYSVDGGTPLEFDDPAPLEGGRIGFWSDRGNGMLIARTRVSYKP